MICYRHWLLPAWGLALLTLSACADLKVQVDVLDPAYIQSAKEEAALRRDAGKLMLGDRSEAPALAQILKNQVLATRLKSLNLVLEASAKYNQKASKKDNQNDIQGQNEKELAKIKSDPKLDNIVTSFLNNINEIEDKAVKQLQSYLTSSNSKLISTPYLQTPLSSEILASLIERRARMTQFKIDIQNRIDAAEDLERFSKIFDARSEKQKTSSAEADRESTKKEIEEATQKENETGKAIVEQVTKATIFGDGTSLANRVEAYIATSEDAKTHWAKAYNKAFGSGHLGGTDIAIKMNSTADFSVKGFVFDGRSTAQMVSKIGIQALSVVAAAYGAPAVLAPKKDANSDPTQPSTTTLDIGSTVAATTTAIAAAQAQDAAFRSALFRIADAILANKDHLSTPSAKDIIQAAFDSRKEAWPTPPHPNAAP